MADLSMDHLVEFLIEGDRKQAVTETERLLRAGTGREEIVTRGIEVAMQRLESKCTLEQFNLLEIMLAGRAVTEVIRRLYPIDNSLPDTKGTVVIATLEGDVHDLGKNILKMVLAADGYRVIDCGKDCPVETVVKTAQKEAARAVCISGLITPMIPLTRMVRPELARLGMKGTVIVAGGAALKMANTESLNVDCVCESAFDARQYLDRVLGGPGPA